MSLLLNWLFYICIYFTLFSNIPFFKCIPRYMDVNHSATEDSINTYASAATFHIYTLQLYVYFAYDQMFN